MGLTECVVIVVVLALCQATPIEPQTLAHDTPEPLLQPKLPETAQLGKDFESMTSTFKQELAEMEGDKIQRQADYASKRTEVQGNLDFQNTKLLNARATHARCQQRLGALMSFNNTIQEGLRLSSEASLQRNSQRVERVERGEAVLKRAQIDKERVSEIARKLQVELETDPRARGRGVRFDSFVTQHDDAVQNLKIALQKTATLLELIERKERHTHLARDTLRPVLQCQDCQKSNDLLISFSNAHPAVVESLNQNCQELASRREVDIMEKRLHSITNKLNSLNDEESIQIKLEVKRQGELALQQESVSTLQKQTAQHNQTAHTKA